MVDGSMNKTSVEEGIARHIILSLPPMQLKESSILIANCFVRRQGFPPTQLTPVQVFSWSDRSCLEALLRAGAELLVLPRTTTSGGSIED